MSDERYTFESTRARLDEIFVAVRKKDTSLEQSLDLFEEGVRLANICNELIDQTAWKAPDDATGADGAGMTAEGLETSGATGEPDEAAAALAGAEAAGHDAGEPDAATGGDALDPVAEIEDDERA